MATRNPYINSAELNELSQLQVSRSFAAIGFDWIVIFLAVAVSEYGDSWLLYPAAILVIGGRMHALGVLMHEAAHYRLHPDRKVGEWLSDILLAWPIMATTDNYRQNHLLHHRYTNTEKDPDWTAKLGDPAFTFPQKMRFLVLRLTGYLLSVNSFRDTFQILRRLSRNDRSAAGYKFARLAYYAGFIALFAYAGWLGEFFLYWVVPLFTTFFLFLYIRSVAEHFGSMEYGTEMTGTRSVAPYFWERWFFAPHNINYHIEHHLFPSIPFYNLPKLQEILLRNPAYRKRAHLTRGYATGVLRECIS